MRQKVTTVARCVFIVATIILAGAALSSPVFADDPPDPTVPAVNYRQTTCPDPTNAYPQTYGPDAPCGPVDPCIIDEVTYPDGFALGVAPEGVRQGSTLWGGVILCYLTEPVAQSAPDPGRLIESAPEAVGVDPLAVTLPETGRTSWPLVVIAGFLVTFGAATLAFSRRPD